MFLMCAKIMGLYCIFLQVLLRNRAIECQCFVVAAAQTGRHNDKRSSYGHSMVKQSNL